MKKAQVHTSPRDPSPSSTTTQESWPERLNHQLRDLEGAMPEGSLVVINVRYVLRSLAANYPLGPTWLFDDLIICPPKKENCAVLQWKNPNIYCSVYPNLVSIDKRDFVSPDTKQFVEHFVKEFGFIDPNEILEKFGEAFAPIYSMISQA